VTTAGRKRRTTVSASARPQPDVNAGFNALFDWTADDRNRRRLLLAELDAHTIYMYRTQALPRRERFETLLPLLEKATNGWISQFDWQATWQVSLEVRLQRRFPPRPAPRRYSYKDIRRGQVYGRLTVKGAPSKKPDIKDYFVMTECGCGTVKAIRTSDLLHGRTESCGCLQRQRARGYDGPRRHRLDVVEKEIVLYRLENGETSTAIARDLGVADSVIEDPVLGYIPPGERQCMRFAECGGYLDHGRARVCLTCRKSWRWCAGCLRLHPVTEFSSHKNRCSKTRTDREPLKVNKNNTSGYLGVYILQYSIVAKIYNSTTRHLDFLGSFGSREDAARAYDEAAIRLKGPGAKTNRSLGLLKDEP
jgi:hypothetical protein